LEEEEVEVEKRSTGCKERTEEGGINCEEIEERISW
ncbi:hypothetical protein T05_6260, partial [Trichinella murrelli]